MSEPRERFGWIDVPTGRFEMGRVVEPDHFGEGPPRHVTVGQFAMMSKPVSTHQFAGFVDSTGYVTVAEREGSGFANQDGEPALVPGLSWRSPLSADTNGGPDSNTAVTQVCWFDAVAFAEWAGEELAGAALPTEAEWEYAAGLGVLGAGELANEWVADWFSATFHSDEQRVNPTGPDSGQERVVRSHGPIRTSRRGALPDLCGETLGFRLTSRIAPGSVLMARPQHRPV